MRAIVAIAFTSIAIAFLLVNCASAPTQQAAAPRPITCKAGPDCDAKWSRAVSWVTTNSSYKIQTQTESIVQTMGPLRSDPSPAFTVTKVAEGNDSYEITFTGGCGNILGCIPTIPESRIKFTNFVLAMENLAPAPQAPSTAAIVLGVHLMPIAQANGTGAKSEAASGLYVAQVDAGTPAERAGIIKGDVILSYAGKPVDALDDLRAALGATKPGSTVLLTIWRSGADRKLSVKFDAPKSRTAPQPAEGRGGV